MTVLSDKWITVAAKKGMIKPFVKKQIRKGKISFGLSSYGYDARVSNEFKIFTNVNSGIVDPKVFKKDSFVTKIGKECIIPPNSFALARTIEYFKIPENVLVICLGKSTYARCGIIVNVTPLLNRDGKVTLHLSFQTLHHYLQKYMLMKVFHNLFLLKGTKNLKLLMPKEKESI